MSSDTSGSITSSSSRNWTVNTPNSEADTGRLTRSRVPPSKWTPVDVLPTSETSNGASMLPPGSWRRNESPLPSAITSLPLRTVSRKAASSPEISTP